MRDKSSLKTCLQKNGLSLVWHPHTHSYLRTLPGLTQHGGVYTWTNPISPFECHNSLLLICLFEICDESAIFCRDPTQALSTPICPC